MSCPKRYNIYSPPLALAELYCATVTSVAVGSVSYQGSSEVVCATVVLSLKYLYLNFYGNNTKALYVSILLTIINPGTAPKLWLIVLLPFPVYLTISKNFVAFLNVQAT